MFSCVNCNFSFSSILKYNEHQKTHKTSVQQKIPCLYPNCKAVLSNYLSFSHHLLRFHRSQTQYTCQYDDCNFKCNNIKLLQKHHISHSTETNVITCSHCMDKKTFSSKNAYAVHLCRFHKSTRYKPLNDMVSEKPNKNQHSEENHSFIANDDINVECNKISNKLVVFNKDTSTNVKSLKRSHHESCGKDFEKTFGNDSLQVKIARHEKKLSTFQCEYSKNEKIAVLNNESHQKQTDFSITISENDDSIEDSGHHQICYPTKLKDDYVKRTTVVSTGPGNRIFNEIGGLSDNTDDEAVAENSLAVNSLYWEVKDYISNAEKKKDIENSIEKLARVYLKMSVQHFATETVLNGMAGGIYSAFDQCQTIFLKSISSLDLPEKSVESVKSLFNSSFKTLIKSHNPEDGVLRNTYNRKKFNKKTFNYIEPIEISILDDEEIETSDCYSYVSPLETVKNWLNDENVRNFCMKPRSANDNGYFDVKDGNLLKNNTFFNKSNTVQLGFFQDGFELCNPIGAAKSKFKMVGLYLTLLNVPAFLRSKTDNLKLVMLCKNEYIAKWGWTKILKQFISDIRILETEGVSINIDSKLINFTGGIVIGIGDNLGNHSIGGFAENFSKVEYICRFCEIKLSEFRNNPFDRKKLRDVASYDECARTAMRTKKVVKGIKLISPLNTLEHYNVAAPALACCLAHDFYEGIVPSDLFMAIMYFIKKKKWFHLGLLNYRMNSICLHNETKKFIPNIKKDSKTKKLTGTASQIRRLLMILPLVIYDKIRDASDPVWQMVLKLREICCIASAPALSYEQVIILQNVIYDYMALRQRNFQQALKPKHEFIMHYPMLIQEFGPLKHVWTLRFESKHSYFRSIAESCKNFKNIHMLLAEKHELLQASLDNQYDITVDSKDASLYDPNKYEEDVSLLIEGYFEDNKNEATFISKSVTFCGVNYTENMAVCIGKNTFGNFVICHIKYILINEDLNYIHFIGWTDEIVSYSELGIFEIARYKGVENRSRWLGVFPYANLLSPDPLPKYTLQSCPVYLMKYVPYDPMD